MEGVCWAGINLFGNCLADFLDVNKYSSWIFESPNSALRFMRFNIQMGKQISFFKSLKKQLSLW